MRSRRKRKKLKEQEEFETEDSPSEVVKPVEEQPLVDPSLKYELDADLDDTFDTPSLMPSEGKAEEKSAIPSPEDKVGLRVHQKTNTEEAEEETVRITAASRRPEKKEKSSYDSHLTKVDALGSLEDDPVLPDSPSTSPTNEVLASEPVKPETQTPAPQPTPDPVAQPELQETEPVLDSADTAEDEVVPEAEPLDWKEAFKAKLRSLSLIEQASLGLIVLILAAATIWSSSVVSANIPSTIIASKLKYPLKGEFVSIASFESYWRSPIREGEMTDEGVSETLSVIPEVKITLSSDSKAKALRILFRDEEGRLVGDPTTIKTLGGKFLPGRSVTSSSTETIATIHSTKGFRFGELISYLADDEFQWEAVIYESKDGEKFQEFIAIPLSPNRKD